MRPPTARRGPLFENSPPMVFTPTASRNVFRHISLRGNFLKPTTPGLSGKELRADPPVRDLPRPLGLKARPPRSVPSCPLHDQHRSPTALPMWYADGGVSRSGVSVA